MIVPTIGRVVWYWEGGPHGPDNQARAALVAYVWTDRMVNLAVFDPNGIPYNRTSVRLLQEGEAIDPGEEYAEWMPYQIGQAKKNEVPMSNV